MLFIYWLEDNRSFAPRVQALFDDLEDSGATLCTSIIAVGEASVLPHHQRDYFRVAAIRDFFSRPSIRLLPFTMDTADSFAQIRAAYRVSPADAIHLASAATAGVDLFVTHDAALRKLRIPGIRFMAGLDGKIF